VHLPVTTWHTSLSELVLPDLAWVYFRQGKYKEAEELYVQSLKVRQAALGDSHPDVARYQSYQTIVFERPHVHTLTAVGQQRSA
jgi:hypothetical protein